MVADSLGGESTGSVSMGYLPSSSGQPTEVFLPPSSDVSDSTPNQPGPQSIPPPLSGGESPHSNPAGAAPASSPSGTGHVFVTVPTSSTPQSVNVDQPPPALIPIPEPQQSGTETGKSDTAPIKTTTLPTRRGRGRGRGRIGGRGYGGRSAHLTSGGMYSSCNLLENDIIVGVVSRAW